MTPWPGDHSPLVGIEKSPAHATPGGLQHLPGVTPCPIPLTAPLTRSRAFTAWVMG